MSLHGSMLASVAGQKPRCPQFVGIAKFLRRNLMAILAADVVGYSRLAGMDEGSHTGTASRPSGAI
jgi:hypothetical protein